MDRTVRVRSLVWFALGVVTALAASLVVARSWSASAAPGSDGAATFVPVEPCRLFDYRPTPFTVGNRNVPLGPGETYVQQVTGAVGDCAVPADATAVAMNVTITQPTEASFLTIFPADVVTVPTVSSLNWVAGQAPTPNQVDVQLSPTGQIKLYNRFGQVFVIADVVGYYSHASLAALDVRIEALDRAQPFAVRARGSDLDVITSDARTMVSMTTGEPAVDGTFTVDYSITVEQDEPGAMVECRLDNLYIGAAAQRWESPGSPGAVAQLSGTGSWDHSPGSPDAGIVLLRCHHSGAVDPTIASDAVMTAVFTPSP